MPAPKLRRCDIVVYPIESDTNCHIYLVALLLLVT